jgi:hypothetical protein
MAREAEHARIRLRAGLTLLACGVALGAASSVALANAIYDMVR